MKCWASFHGGYSYVFEEKVTEFPSIRAALAEYERRRYDNYYPCWDEWNEPATVGYIYFRPLHNNSNIDEYPDRIILRGRRGGLYTEMV